jgi:uncharacterized membrane protein
MSNLFREYRESAVNNSVPVNLITFLFFSFMWSMGVMCGVILCILGVRIGVRIDKDREEMERMIARMNKEGPNN